MRFGRPVVHRFRSSALAVGSGRCRPV